LRDGCRKRTSEYQPPDQAKYLLLIFRASQFLETLLDIYEDGSLEFSPQETGFDVYSDLASLTTAKTVETDEEVLNSLLQMPHKSYTLADVPEDVNNACSSNFLDPTYRDEYLSHLDSQLLEAPLPDDVFAKQSRPPSSRVLLSEKELANQNADSVISWLRRNHPETFIQDGEKEKTEPRKRGGGKRASLAQPTATVKHEHEDGDDDMSYVTEPPEKPARGRKSKDDEPYRPKGGSSRSTKRKRAADDGEKGRGKRAKANAS